MLDNPLLDFLQVVMIFVEYLPGAGQIEHILGRGLPWQFEHQLQVGPRYLIIRRRGGQAFQAIQLARGFLANILRQVGLVQPAAQFGGIGLLRIAIAQLFLNRPQLLPQEVFFLFPAQLRLGLARRSFAAVREPATRA